MARLPFQCNAFVQRKTYVVAEINKRERLPVDFSLLIKNSAGNIRNNKAHLLLNAPGKSTGFSFTHS